jgi:hypothetical protein
MGAMEELLYGIQPGVTYPEPIVTNIENNLRIRNILWQKQPEAAVIKEVAMIRERHNKPQ